MASGGNDDDSQAVVVKDRFLGCKVYKRRVFKKKASSIVAARTLTLNNSVKSSVIAPTTGLTNDVSEANITSIATAAGGTTSVITSPCKPQELPPSGDLNAVKQPVVSQLIDLSDDDLLTGRDYSGLGIENAKIRSKQNMMEMRRKLKWQLNVVRNVVKKFDVREGDVVEFNRFFPATNVVVNNKLKRAHSELGPREGYRQSRPLNQLTMSGFENSQAVGSEHVEKEKRTPKANQFYRNSEFLLAKDKFPPLESSKKFKSNGKKHNRTDVAHGFGPSSKIFKRCAALLEKLMKHKHGWVFNTPVDAKTLGLHDYFIIIKYPMDLGTIKTRLNDNWYKSPKEFAEDVRLTFNNAMTYNPKGQDVHVMAEQLSNMFEDKWATLEADYDRELKFSTFYDSTLHTPTSRKTNSFPVPAHLDMRKVLDRSVSMAPRIMSVTPSSRIPVLKKPKARDPNKREMTYDEKQKLSTNLSNLPTEKLDIIIQIMKKRSSAILQRDDEIEVDIDVVDTETLWELDRFVTNYKKSLSKNKRKAELAMQAKTEAERKKQKTPDQTMVEAAPNENTTAEKSISSSVPVEMEKPGDNKSRSSSSSSSSSDSGSSSSDSDSDSSSASGSDVGGSQ
ncbi:hypothetical protein ACFE04_031161 [Oxalis oulophora]